MVGLMKKENITRPSLEGLERARKKLKELYEREPSEEFIKAIDRTKRTKIEYVTCPMTGTVEEMEVQDEDYVCPVVREYEKRQ